jgi:hypothetical protein
VGITLCPHIQCASLNCQIGIIFRAPTFSVDSGHNVGIIVFPHIQCVSLNCHVGITFIFSINSVVC